MMDHLDDYNTENVGAGSMRRALKDIFNDRYDFEEGELEPTPRRLVQAIRELTTPEEFEFTTFPAVSDEMVFCGPIPFVSLCAHHLLPFIGEAYVAYVPNKKMAGLSKLSRTVRYCAAGLQVQEALTMEIVDYLETHLSARSEAPIGVATETAEFVFLEDRPLGIAVSLSAEHTCQTIRGAKSSGTKTITTKVTGVFADHDRTAKAEFLAAIERSMR